MIVVLKYRKIILKDMNRHKKDSLKEEMVNCKLYKYFNEHGWDIANIELFSKHQFETKKQLLEEENKYIEKYLNDPKCLNCVRAVENKEAAREKKNEYAGTHKDKTKSYLQSNKELINQKRKKYVSEHREQRLNTTRKYYINHKERIRAK